MTVTNEKYKDLVTTDGVAVTFPFSFKVTNPDWVKGLLAEVAGAAPVEVTGFTVTLYPDQQVQQGGTLTFVTAPAAGTLAIVRDVPATQLLDYTAFGAFPAESHEKGMDKITFQQQSVDNNLNVRYGYETDFTAPSIAVIEKFLEAGNLLYWKADGSIGSSSLDEVNIPTKGYVDAGDLALQNQINALDPRVAAVEQTSVSNAVAIVDHETRISTNEGAIATIEPRVTQNETSISDHESRISTNETNIGSNTGRITTNESALTTKVDKTTAIISSDPQMVSITDPNLGSDVTLNLRSNVANGVTKLNEFGFVPESQVPPTGGIRLFGLWDASTGSNPTDTRPDAQPYASGDSYITYIAGTIPLLDPVTGLETPTALIVGDLIIYIINYDNTVIGWQKGASVLVGTVVAGNVVLTPYLGITETNAQSGMQGLEDRKAKLAGGNAFTGVQTFAGNVTLSNNVPLVGRNAANTADLPLVRATNGDVVKVGSGTANTEIDSGAQIELKAVGVVRALVTASGLDVTGALSTTGNIKLPNNVPLAGRNAADTANVIIARVSPTDILVVGNNSVADTELAGATSVSIYAAGVLRAVINAAGLDVNGEYYRNGVLVPVVVSEGSNANGYYRVWSNGFKQMWRPWDQINHNGTTRWTFPVALTNIASANFNIIGDSDATRYIRQDTLSTAGINLGLEGSSNLNGAVSVQGY